MNLNDNLAFIKQVSLDNQKNVSAISEKIFYNKLLKLLISQELKIDFSKNHVNTYYIKIDITKKVVNFDIKIINMISSNQEKYTAEEIEQEPYKCHNFLLEVGTKEYLFIFSKTVDLTIKKKVNSKDPVMIAMINKEKIYFTEHNIKSINNTVLDYKVFNFIINNIESNSEEMNENISLICDINTKEDRFVSSLIKELKSLNDYIKLHEII